MYESAGIRYSVRLGVALHCVGMDKRLILNPDEVTAFDEISGEYEAIFEVVEEHVLDQSLLLMIHDS